LSEITASPPASTSATARALAALALVLALGAGLWALGALAPGYVSSIVLSAAWLVAVGIVAEGLARRRPSLKVALRGAFVVAVAVSVFGFYWTSIRDDVVHEQVVVGVAASRLPAATPAAPAAPRPAINVTELTGEFETLAHDSKGTASVVRRARGGRVLTLAGFRTSNGPDLRVYLVAGKVNGNGDGDGSVDLGRLKGNIGNQQYDIPAGTDLRRYATVVIWCRAFTVGFARARLTAA